jgi:plasmid maintenance system antidote protein VapI
MSDQIAIPVEIRPEEVAREKTLGGAIELCAKVAGYDLDKQLAMELDVDKAQFSRWTNGTEGITWPKLRKLMDRCGNNAPVLWMLYQMGYDLHSLRKRETETERRLRDAEEALARERADRAALEESFRRMLVGGQR